MALAAAGHRAEDDLRGPTLTGPAAGQRLDYLDWLRGLAVIFMVEAHVVDAWTREADRQGTGYFYAVFTAGLAAPLFLFLAGVALSMAASARALKTDHAAAARAALTRGAQVFGLAFLFRLQSQLLGWGPLANFLKVDILNVMGLAMVAAALIWALLASRTSRVLAFAMVTALVAMTTPLVRETAVLALLPDPIEAYVRPLPSRSNFALFPWAAFLFAGAIVGECVASRRGRGDRTLQLGFLAAGVVGVGAAYWASFQPSIYAVSSFWTSSPTFFFIRLGICTTLVPIARLIAPLRVARFGGQADFFTVLGRSSLFVYWIHVEMVYGVIGRPLRLLLPLPASIAATLILCLVLYRITLWKKRVMEGVTLTGPTRIFAPVLK